jgi:hypothetical protein
MKMMKESQLLFHVSEERGIERFEPRPVPSPDSGVEGLAVWAVDDAHLPNFLLPRDCPRVTFRVGANTTADDRAMFLPDKNTRHVVAVEARCYRRIASCRIFLYEMPLATFENAVAAAGYFISRVAVTPLRAIELSNPIDAILERGVELRFVPDLWPLRDEIVESSLEFSMIRMKNAAPRR